MIPFQRIKTENAEVSRLQDAVERFTLPLVRTPPLDGVLLENKTLTRGVNTIPHLLNRKLRGWQATRVRPPTDLGTSDAPLVNAWVDFGATFAEGGYRRDANGRVHLRGVIKSGTTASGTVLFTLPEGFRPAARETFNPLNISAGALAHSRVDVHANGEVTIVNGGNDVLSLNGISFDAALNYTPAPFLYDTQDALPDADKLKFLRLVSPAAMTVDLWVF